METEEAGDRTVEAGTLREPRRLPTRRRGTSIERRKLTDLRQSHRRLRKRFAIVTAVLSLLTVAFGGWALRVTQQNRELLATRYTERSELASAREGLEQARGEIDALVQGRIPSLHAIELDAVLDVGDRYVRNVAFTLVREGSTSSYEYKMVLQNETDIMVHPEVEILMFDRLGVQMGRAHVGLTPELTSDPPTLYPGEVRSYAGTLDLARETDPAYFFLEIR